MKIVFFGDSITDMRRSYTEKQSSCIWSYGSGYPFLVASDLYRIDPIKYQVINRGVSGNGVVDLYARIKGDVWNLKPDVLSILIGVNDVWHEIQSGEGVDLARFEKTYRNIIEETLSELPNVKIILCEPFFLKGEATQSTQSNPTKYERFKVVYEYAKVVKKLAEEYELCFVPLQEKFNEASKKFGEEQYLYDGVHPMIAGATLIADEWLKVFKELID